MRHGALRNLHQHRVDGLLQREAQVLGCKIGRARLHLRSKGIDAGEDARKGAVHALDGVGQVQQLGAVLRHLFNVVARGRVVAYLERAREAVEAVADGNIERLAKYAVALLGVGNDLGVAAGDVEDDGVLGASDLAAHFNVADAVVYTDEGNAPKERDGACADGDGGERRAHAWALGEADAVDLGAGVGDVGFGEGTADESNEFGAVMRGRVFREEPGTGGRDKGVTEVREDGGLGRGVLDNANAELVGGALTAECYP